MYIDLQECVYIYIRLLIGISISINGVLIHILLIINTYFEMLTYDSNSTNINFDKVRIFNTRHKLKIEINIRPMYTFVICNDNKTI